MSLALTPDQPWLGLASYEEEHRPYFFGRRAEEDDLFERVRRHRLTVLYGPSGLGKTSLLRAGLMPRLQAAGWLPVRIRLTYPERLDTIVEADPQSLLRQVIETLAAALIAAAHPAGEKLRTPLSETINHQLSTINSVPSLWELWHDTAWGLRDPSAPRPVLLFDQFEEIFTLGEDEARARSATRVLRDALADLIEDRPPPALDRRLQEDPALAERYDFSPDTSRVVLVLREDYLARFERWKKLLPSLLRNRLELRLLDGPRALQAITGPARTGRAEGDPGLVPDDVAAAIVRAVSDVSEDTAIEDIEAVPPLLSLLCKELNEKRRTATPPVPHIDLALVRENRSAILQRFYEECFDGFAPAVRLVIEDHLLSPGGYRENPGYDTLLSALAARGVEAPVKVLSALVERRLITAEDRGGRRRVELTHDVLAPIVKSSLDERREREAAETASRQLAEEAAKTRRRRALVAVMALLTLLAGAGAVFGWLKAGAASEAAQHADRQRGLASAAANRAESALADSRRQLDRSWFEEGRGWLESARTAKEKGDHLTALLLAGRAVGFQGYGRRDPEDPAIAAAYPLLLGQPLLADPAVEKQRLAEVKAVADFVSTISHSTLPIWSSPVHDQHRESVTSVVFSPDGTKIASGSEDNTIKVWESATGKELATLSGHSDRVTSVAFSPDGSRIASGSWDKTIKVWESATGKEVATFAGHSESVTSVAFSPDGSRIASGSRDKTIKVWESATGKEVTTLPGHADGVTSVAFSPDGSRIASGSRDKTIKVWESATGKEVTTLRGDEDGATRGVTTVAFSPDGSRIASGSQDQTITIWESATGKEVARLLGHSDTVTSVAFSPDGSRIASGSADETIKIWEDATGKVVTLAGNCHVTSVAFSPDGSRIASALGGTADSLDKRIKVWDSATRREVTTLLGHRGDGEVTSVAFSADGSRIASGDWASIKVWDSTTGTKLATLAGHSGTITSVAFSPDGSRIASGSDHKTIKVWESATGKVVAALSGHLDTVRCVTFSLDGSRIASGSDDKTIRVWESATGKELATLAGHSSGVIRVAFSPDGTRIASATGDGPKVYETVTGKEVAGQPDFSSVTEVSPDGRWHAVTNGLDIRIVPNNTPLDLLAPERAGYLTLKDRKVVWRTSDSHSSAREFPVLHWRRDLYQRLAQADLTASERMQARLQLCARGGQWRAELPIWKEAQESGLADDAAVRREFLVHLAVFARLLAVAAQPSAPEEIWSLLTTVPRAGDFADPRFSLAFIQAVSALLRQPALNQAACDALKEKLPSSAPVAWLEAVADTLAPDYVPMQDGTKQPAHSAFLLVLADAHPTAAMLRAAVATLRTTDAGWTKLTDRLLALPEATADDFNRAAITAVRAPALSAKVKEILQQAEARFAGEESVHRKAGWCFIILQEPASAPAAFARARALLKSEEKPGADLLAGMALANWLNGDKAAAIEHYRELIETGRELGEARDWALAQTIADLPWPEAEKKPMEALRTAAVQKHPDLAKPPAEEK